MKRLNPLTGSPFKWGFKREDGFIFSGYQISSKKPQKNGFYQEQWLTEEKFNKRKTDNSERGKLHSKQKRLTTIGRAKCLIGSARQRGIVTISEDWVVKKIENGFCEISGIAFQLSCPSEFFKNPYSPSLDRIDSKNKEYSPENTRVVVTCINEALNAYGLDHFLKISELTLNYQNGIK